MLGLLGARSPAILWVYGPEDWGNDGFDHFAQVHLYMGVFPMAPFPDADHSLPPSDAVDELYTKYGKMFQALRGKRWVLSPHAAKASSGKINAFDIVEASSDTGESLQRLWPVMLGAPDATVTVSVEPPSRGCKTVERLFPGATENWQPVPVSKSNSHARGLGDRPSLLTVNVTLAADGCVMIRCTSVAAGGNQAP